MSRVDDDGGLAGGGVDADRLRGGLLRLIQGVAVVVVALLGASVAVGAVVPALVAAGVVADGGVGAEYAGMVVQFVSFMTVVGLFVVGAGRTELLAASVPDRRDALLFAGGYVALLVLQFVSVWLLGIAGVSTGTNRVVELGRETPVLFLYLVPLSVLLVGPAEELLFRGTVQGLLRDSWGPRAAVAAASLVFGAIHYWSVVGGGPVERLLYVAVAAVLGAVLGMLYEVTGNLVVPALAHGAYNATLFVIQYLNATGGV
ncbi:MAG: lysostaphin resistance A-like protein [Halolamina sp.]